MTVEIANALYGYFETLYDLNRNLIMLCGVDVIDNSGQYEKYRQEIIQEIPRLVPYAYNKNDGKYKIVMSDGLLEFSDVMPFLKGDYKCILQENYSFLSDIKCIRNKFEHKLHGARLMASGSGSTSLFDMTYTLKEGDITLTANEFIKFTKHMNELFSKIQGLVDKFAYKQGEFGHPYYRRLIRYDFRDFNRIYESDLLRSFGQALFPF